MPCRHAGPFGRRMGRQQDQCAGRPDDGHHQHDGSSAAGAIVPLGSAGPGKAGQQLDVVCLAPEFSKGLDDYARFIKKHQNIFGVTDDAAIEKGVGHVHPALTELRPELLEGSVRDLNRDMLRRVELRQQTRDLWKIGTPYRGEPRHTLEMRMGESPREQGGFPPFAGADQPWSSVRWCKRSAKRLPARWESWIYSSRHPRSSPSRGPVVTCE